MTFNNHSVISAKDGRAGAVAADLSRWSQLPNPIGLVRNAPHPNAAKLFLEYMLSPEGQTVFRDANYIPAEPGGAAEGPDADAGGRAFHDHARSRRR